jgi:hypothetical protein
LNRRDDVAAARDPFVQRASGRIPAAQQLEPSALGNFFKEHCRALDWLAAREASPLVRSAAPQKSLKKSADRVRQIGIETRH